MVLTSPLPPQPPYQVPDEELPPILRERSQALADLGRPHEPEGSALRDLASAMQRQLELLTRAVEELREVGGGGHSRFGVCLSSTVIHWA